MRLDEIVVEFLKCGGESLIKRIRRGIVWEVSVIIRPQYIVPLYEGKEDKYVPANYTLLNLSENLLGRKSN